MHVTKYSSAISVIVLNTFFLKLTDSFSAYLTSIFFLTLLKMIFVDDPLHAFTISPSKLVDTRSFTHEEGFTLLAKSGLLLLSSFTIWALGCRPNRRPCYFWREIDNIVYSLMLSATPPTKKMVLAKMTFMTVVRIRQMILIYGPGSQALAPWFHNLGETNIKANLCKTTRFIQFFFLE